MTAKEELEDRELRITIADVRRGFYELQAKSAADTRKIDEDIKVLGLLLDSSLTKSPTALSQTNPVTPTAPTMQAPQAPQGRIPDERVGEYFGLKANGMKAQELKRTNPAEYDRLEQVATDLRIAAERKLNSRRR